MSTSIETIRPGVAWNATRVASVLMVVMIMVIALAFWPEFEASDAKPPPKQQAGALVVPDEPIVVNGQVCGQCLP